jgi:hypothetical protein
MKENEQTEKEFSFICWKCKKATFYDIVDVLSSGSELLLEKYSVQSQLKQDYFINCQNPECGVSNKIKIE